MDLLDVTPTMVRRMGQREFRRFTAAVLEYQQNDRRENALRYYRPAHPQALKIHEAHERVIGVGGGNRSSKTETCLVEMMVCATGVVPVALEHVDYASRIQGPRNQRIVIESLTSTLHQTILSKLKWWVWTGAGEPGGDKGHWGWIPRHNLIDGSWDKSWSEKHRVLRVLCRDPSDPERVMGESTIQFCSHDMDPSDFASGSFHDILHDEPPREAIYKENEARVMDVKGRIFLAMTWPDDPAIQVDWIHDRIYDRGQGPGKRDDTVWINLFTTDNQFIDQDSVAAQAEKWSEEEKAVRLLGQPIRFSNRIHPLFTNQARWWCFGCKAETYPDAGTCGVCGSAELQTYNHVASFDVQPTWPTVYLLDPHPRKPHMMSWWQVSPQDDLWMVDELEIEGGTEEVAEAVEMLEEDRGYYITQRLMDPNMGASPSSAAQRGRTWQDEFGDCGLRCDLADDAGSGRMNINSLLKPDPHTYSPRIVVHERCQRMIYQMLRYCWSDHKQQNDRDIKQKPREKDDDFPTLLKYLVNSSPEFSTLTFGHQVISRRPASREYHRRGRGRRTA